MIDWTSCNLQISGNLIKWPLEVPSDLAAKVIEEKIPKNKFCQKNAPYLLVLPGKWTFMESRLACKQLRSKTFTYTDRVSKYFPNEEWINTNENYWTGHVCQDGKPGEFVDNNNLSLSISETNLEWNTGEPNGNLYPKGFWTECCTEIVGNDLQIPV